MLGKVLLETVKGQLRWLHGAVQHLLKERKKWWHYDSAASLKHTEENGSPVEAAVSVYFCCAQAVGHMVDPSHGIGDVGKTPCPLISYGKISPFLKKSRKQRLLVTDSAAAQG